MEILRSLFNYWIKEESLPSDVWRIISNFYFCLRFDDQWQALVALSEQNNVFIQQPTGAISFPLSVTVKNFCPTHPIFIICQIERLYWHENRLFGFQSFSWRFSPKTTPWSYRYDGLSRVNFIDELCLNVFANNDTCFNDTCLLDRGLKPLATPRKYIVAIRNIKLWIGMADDLL